MNSIGWQGEGSSYSLLASDDAVDGQTPVEYYRAYNPNAGRHFWTSSLTEYNHLGSIGWNQEGVDGYILENQTDNSVALYRIYNPNNGQHLWTEDANERNTLISTGWNDEGIAGYVLD